ncbi:MAG TPA: 4Fe-4S dicluster domain-containing protein [Anaerolineae bacterium]|nr:4Fe-4S dicluster domain-containing protein [Anaerolineae bacterium]
MSVRLVIDAAECTGCRICEISCSFHHEGAIWPARTGITITAQSDDGPFVPIVCLQCKTHGLTEGDEPPCAASCPEGAITWDARSGAWVVNLEECIGCSICAEACRYGGMVFDDGQGEPECGIMCPSGAILAVSIGGR